MLARAKVRRVRLTRDVVLTTLGIAMLIHQAFFTPQVDQVIVGAAIVLLVGPAAARVDDRKKDKGEQ